MAKAYDPYKDIKGIYDLKGMWEEANKAKNTDAKNKIASDAAAYYQTLKDNGYADIAEDLRTSNYNQAKATLNKYATMNKSPAREYLYTLGASRGMTQADVDKLISWDDSSKQMRFGGKTIGSPDAIVDGVSYFTDTGVLDNAFNDYISRSGTVRKTDTAIKQENENLFTKYNEAYKDITETNPFDTAEAKAILDKYDLSAMNARNGEVASGSSSNGGNIDSFAAANALRQQKALIAQGQQTVLDARQRKIDNIRAILSDMGVNIDRVFNQEETAKNNQTQRDIATAEVTGKVPSSMLYQLPEYSQIFNPDGSLKNPDIDYMAEIQKAEAAGNTNLVKVLKAARGAKIWSDYAKYGKFDDGNYTIPEGLKTEAARRADMEAEQQANALKAQQQIEKDKNSTDLQIADKNNNAKLEAARIEAENKQQALTDNTGTSDVDLLTGDGTVNVVTIDAIDEEKMKSCGVDKHGKSMLEALQKEAAAQGGFLTEDELLEFVKANSNAYNTNLDQLKKVYSYLGADKAKLEALSDAGFWFWEWGKGVK